MNGGKMDSSAADRSFGGMSFVTRTGDRKSKSGVVLLRQISGDDGLLSSKPKKFMLKVDRSTLGILSKDGKTMHKSYPIERCKFKGGAAGEIDAIAPGVRFAIKDKDAKSWLLALQTNSSKMNLTGTSPVAHEGAKRKDSLGFVLNEPPKPHLANRKAMEITVTKAKGSSMGMKVCGGGGPGGDPNRPEIFVFSLEKDGLADRAGLARGDIVISVGKTALTGMVVSAAAKELSKAGGDVMLRILRKVKKHHARENAEPAAAAGVGKFFGEEAGPPDLPAADASTKRKKERRRSKEKAPAKEKPSKKKEKKEKEKKEKKKRSSKKGAATDGPAVANGAAGAAAGPDDEAFGFGPESPGLDQGDGDGEGESFGFDAADAASAEPKTATDEKEEKPKTATPARPAPPPPTAADEKPAAVSAERAARLARLRASRKEKKADWLVKLYESLKIIDDLPE